MAAMRDSSNEESVEWRRQSDYDEEDGGDQENLLMDCPACGEAVYEDAVRCPACGEFVSWNDSPLAGWPALTLWLALLGVLAVIAAVLGLLG